MNENEMKDLTLYLTDEGTVLKDLDKFLNNKKVNEIEIIKNVYNIHKKDKEDILKIVKDNLLDKNKLEKYISYLLENEFDLLKNIIDNNGILIDDDVFYDDFFYLKSLGIIGVVKIDNHLNFYITDDVFNILKSIKLDKVNNIKENQDIYNLIRSMINYYGVVSFDDLENTYEKYYDKKIKVDSRILSFEFRCSMICYYERNNHEYFINEGLNEYEQLADTIIDRQMDIERKDIELDDLLLYQDDDFYDNNEANKEMSKFLKKHNEIDYFNLEHDEIISYINESLRYGVNELYDILETFDIEGVELNVKDTEELIKLIHGIYDLTCVWVNNGWKTIEFNYKFPFKVIDQLDINRFTQDEDDCDCGCHCDNCDGECHCHEDGECHCHDDKD